MRSDLPFRVLDTGRDVDHSTDQLPTPEAQSSAHELIRVAGRESVAGPLQETLELVVEPRALLIRRGRVLSALRGGRDEKRIAFSDLETVRLGTQGGATLNPRKGADIGPSLTLHGPAARVAVASWWASLGREDADLVGAAASYTGPLGLKRSGLAIAGPAGVVFVSTGWAGAVDDSMRRIPIDSVQGVERTDDGEMRLLSTAPGELLLDSSVASVDVLAAWLARCSPRMGGHLPEQEGVFEQTVVWQLNDRGAWIADLGIVEGVLALSPRSPLAPRGTVPVGRVERVRMETAGSGALCVLRFGGAVHALRLRGARAAVVGLERALRRRRGIEGAPLRTPDMKPWRPLVGSHRTVRFFQGAQAELSLSEASVTLSSRGLRVRGTPVAGARTDAELSVGMRVRVNLPSGRGWQHFTAAVCRVAQEDDSATLDLLLVPVSERPQLGDGRRAYHRVEDLDATPIVLSRPWAGRSRWIDGALLDLSAGGFSATVPERPRIGERFVVALPTAEWTPGLEAEVVHLRAESGRSGWRMGVRLVGLTEKLHSLLQREVLRREREVLAARRRRVELRDLSRPLVREWAV